MAVLKNDRRDCFDRDEIVWAADRSDELIADSLGGGLIGEVVDYAEIYRSIV